MPVGWGGVGLRRVQRLSTRDNVDLDFIQPVSDMALSLAFMMLSDRQQTLSMWPPNVGPATPRYFDKDRARPEPAPEGLAPPFEKVVDHGRVGLRGGGWRVQGLWTRRRSGGAGSDRGVEGPEAVYSRLSVERLLSERLRLSVLVETGWKPVVQHDDVVLRIRFQTQPGSDDGAHVAM